MKKVLVLVQILLALVILCTGCKGKEEQQKIDSETKGYMQVYYLNADITKLVPVDYVLQTDPENIKGAIDEVIDVISAAPSDTDYKAPVAGDTIEYKDVTIQDGYVSLDFHVDYKEMDSVTEILCRAAVVKSVTGISTVSNVEIMVDGQPITTKDGQLIGIMNEESFVGNNEDTSAYNQYGDINLYFADKTGKKLKEYPIQLEVSNNTPIAQQIMEYLIKGPSREGYQGTIPDGTKVVKTSVKDGVCYVDLNQKFLEPMNQVTDEVTVYSIVNSLVELPTINKVQFTIEGEKQGKFRETISFDGFFERKLDLIEVDK